ncbi:MAG: alpha/beta fold hydrolase [Bacteroidetes bacterium]|nr:alpha/beta fold hydrolase [Bacteroidota bacterium]
MINFSAKFLLTILLLVSTNAFAQSESIILNDLKWDMTSPASSTELFIPSGNSQIAGLIYNANGLQKHPTLLLLHGYPGNERNLDIAQVVRSRGWNVIYFDYRGSWGSQGKFSFKNCVEDVVNVVSFCNKYQDSLKIDTSNIVLFGHSMGGWVCLKALQELPTIKKGFALSTWDIAKDFKNVSNEKEMLSIANDPNIAGKYFVLNTSLKDLYTPVLQNKTYFNLLNDTNSLSDKQIIMIDEHEKNSQLAKKIKESNKSYFDYSVWQTDHSFTNKRASLINKVLAFIEK